MIGNDAWNPARRWREILSPAFRPRRISPRFYSFNPLIFNSGCSVLIIETTPAAIHIYHDIEYTAQGLFITVFMYRDGS
jgi:hypothetical protein